MDLPVGVLTSKLIGRFIEIDADDPGEALPAAFHIEIHPSVSFTRHTAVQVGVSLPVIYATLDAEGYLMEKGGNESGIIVLASDDAGSEVQDITYTFVLSAPGLNESFTVYAEAGVDFDVVSALRVPESSNEPPPVGDGRPTRPRSGFAHFGWCRQQPELVGRWTPSRALGAHSRLAPYHHPKPQPNQLGLFGALIDWATRR